MRSLSIHIAGCITIVILLLCLCSCEKASPKSITEYKAWFNDPENGYLCSRNIGNIEYIVQYRPSALMSVNEVESMPTLSNSKFDSVKSAYDNADYFLMIIKPAKNIDKINASSNPLTVISKNYADYSDVLKQMAFKINENVSLIVNKKDTLSSLIYHFEPGYELTHEQRFIFCFSSSKKNIIDEASTFIYTDKIFGGGRIKFSFNPSKDIPQIPIDNI